MSRKDRGRAQSGKPFRNEYSRVSEATIGAIASKVDVSDVAKKEGSRLTLDEIKDCRRIRELGKLMPVSYLKPKLLKGIPKDMAAKSKELKAKGLPYDAQAVFEYYWSEEEYQRACTMGGLTEDDIIGLARQAIPEDGAKPENKPWYRRIL